MFKSISFLISFLILSGAHTARAQTGCGPGHEEGCAGGSQLITVFKCYSKGAHFINDNGLQYLKGPFSIEAQQVARGFSGGYSIDLARIEAGGRSMFTAPDLYFTNASKASFFTTQVISIDLLQGFENANKVPYELVIRSARNGKPPVLQVVGKRSGQVVVEAYMQCR